MTVTFEIEGQEFMGLNGGPQFQFSPAISFVIHCKTQKKLDYYWDRLLEGGAPLAVRLAHRQVRSVLASRPHHPAQAAQGQGPGPGVGRSWRPCLKMVKLDARVLKQAYKGKPATAAASKA